jgi:hypothetical protein
MNRWECSEVPFKARATPQIVWGLSKSNRGMTLASTGTQSGTAVTTRFSAVLSVYASRV